MLDINFEVKASSFWGTRMIIRESPENLVWSLPQRVPGSHVGLSVEEMIQFNQLKSMAKRGESRLRMTLGQQGQQVTSRDAGCVEGVSRRLQDVRPCLTYM